MIRTLVLHLCLLVVLHSLDYEGDPSAGSVILIKCCRITCAGMVWLFLCFFALQGDEVQRNLFDVDTSQGVSIGAPLFGHSGSGHKNSYRLDFAVSSTRVKLDGLLSLFLGRVRLICPLRTS